MRRKKRHVKRRMFNMHTTMLYYFKQEPKEKERIAKSTILKCSSTFL
jgi:hypothetical protein